MQIQSINPANGSVLRSYATLTKKALTSKVKAADEASWKFRRTTVESRAMWLKKLAGILEHEMEELATLLTSETGRTIVSTRQEILDCAACCRYFAGHAEGLPTDSKVPMEMSSCEIRWQPLGVVLAIMQAESPFWQVFRFLAPALLAGDTVLLRHANAVCQSAMEIELLVVRAGFPRDVVQTLLIGERQLGPLLSEKQISAVAVGEQVMSGRAMVGRVKGLLRTTGQERSSNPFVVMPSANLFAAIQAGVRARCAENGMASAGAARFVVHEAIYEEFELLFVAGMEDVKIGDPGKDETVVGPLPTAAIVGALETQIAATVRDGGKLLTGGQRMVGVGHYFEPTVIAGVGSGKKTRKTVFHGPVAMLFKVASVEAAIEVANEMPNSLGASVWTQDPDEQQDFSVQLECESVFFNGVVPGDPLMALIGDRQSRNGGEVAAAMLREMMTARTIVVADPLPNAEMDLDFPLLEEAAFTAAAPAEEMAARRFADVLSATEEDSLERLEPEPAIATFMQARMTEQAAMEAVAEDSSIAVGVSDLFDAEQDWAPLVTLRERNETAKEAMVEVAEPTRETAVVEATPVDGAELEVVAVETSPVVEDRITIVPAIQKAAPMLVPAPAPVQVKQVGSRKTLMSGVMKHIVDQVISKKKKMKPGVLKTSVRGSETTLQTAKVATPAAAAKREAAEPKLRTQNASAAEPAKAVDLQSMFEKALSSRPAA